MKNPFKNDEQPNTDIVQRVVQPLHMDTMFTIHTAIDCIRYAEKSARYSKVVPEITTAQIARHAYSVIMAFEKNFKRSYQDAQGNWQEEGTGINSLPDQLFKRLQLQTDGAMMFANKVFKTPGILTTEILQQILKYAQNPMEVDCPVEDTEGVRFSELDEGYKAYIAFQTNIAINRVLRAFNGTKTLSIKKASLTASTVDDLANLEIYEKGEMPVDPTPVEGEIITFATDEKPTDMIDRIEVEDSDLDVLITARDNLALWWNLFDRTSDKTDLIDIMVTETREYIAERQKHPVSAAFAAVE